MKKKFFLFTCFSYTYGLFLFLLFLFPVIQSYAQTPVDSTGTGGINVGSVHISWGILSALIAALELLLRALPTGKYASFLGLLAWLNDIIPAKKKTGISQ